MGKTLFVICSFVLVTFFLLYFSTWQTPSLQDCALLHLPFLYSIRSGWEKTHPATNDTWSGGGHITQTHTHVTRQRKSPKMLHRDRAGCQRHSMRGWRWRSKNCKRESKGNDRPRRQIMIIIIQEKKARVIGRRGWLTNHLERILLPSICRDGNAQGQPKMAKETNPLQ